MACFGWGEESWRTLEGEKSKNSPGSVKQAITIRGRGGSKFRPLAKKIIEPQLVDGGGSRGQKGLEERILKKL